jgi:hypothetical protein
MNQPHHQSSPSFDALLLLVLGASVVPLLLMPVMGGQRHVNTSKEMNA